MIPNKILTEILGIPPTAKKATLHMAAGEVPVLVVEMYPNLKETHRFRLVPIDQSPDGYAVVQADGAFVGAWRDRASAELVLNRSQAAKGERIVAITVHELPVDEGSAEP